MTAQEFWNWFEANNKKYLFLNVVDPEEKEKLLDEFMDALHQYNDKLFFAIGGQGNDDQEVIISAEGDVAYFDMVDQLINAAPLVKDWKFIAFKPAIGFDFKIEYKGIRFDPDNIWVLPLESKSQPLSLGLRVGFVDFDESKKSDYLSGTYLMLHDGIGEKQAALDIKYVEVVKLPEDAGGMGYLELKELACYIIWWRNK